MAKEESLAPQTNLQITKNKLVMLSALRQSLQSKPSLQEIHANLLADLTVGVIALPLSMALAITSGVPPQHGLYTAIVAGIVIAFTVEPS